MARFKWRLHHGIHIQNDAKGVERMYRQGDVFESDLELANLNGDITMSPKFERLEEIRVTLGERMPDSRGTVDERMQEVRRRGDEKAEVQKVERGAYTSDIGHYPVSSSPSTSHTDSSRNTSYTDSSEAHKVEKDTHNTVTEQHQPTVPHVRAEQHGHHDQHVVKDHKDSVSQGVKAHTPAKNLQEYSALLDKMSVEDLKAHAAEEEVDLKNATSKDQIIRVLRTSAKG